MDGKNEKRINEIHEELNAIEHKKTLLLSELKNLSKIKEIDLVKESTTLGTRASKKTPVSPTDKIQLFLKLFRCREDVYPHYWENKKKGTKGYSPVCKNEWVNGKCKKPKIKCNKCDNKEFLPLDEKAVTKHLRGEEILGTYAIREDDTCTFLVCDFDEVSWKDDVLAYKKAAQELGIEIAIERSRSGNGAHTWIFFTEPVPARKARQIGDVILTIVSSQKHNFNLKSYDRFFPSQDTIPKGGFGNLIALPLQKKARDSDNTVFVDGKFIAYANQWEYLASQSRISLNDVNLILDTIRSKRNLPFLQPNYKYLSDNADILDAEKTIDYCNTNLPASIASEVKVILNSQLAIFIDGLPSQLIWALKRTATFANPKFFELQRLRFSTWKVPKFIFCGEYEDNILKLPRGCLDKCSEILCKAGSKVEIIDNRSKQNRFRITFSGKLEKEQKKALNEMSKHDTGVLIAPSGAGKTVIACALIAKRKVPTLVIVHRKHLLDQWKERLSTFLSLDKKDIGTLGKGSKSAKWKIDISMMQTISKASYEKNVFSKYSQVIVDECHHVPAFTFESVLKQMPARYILGLTATPYRRDGHQAILYMQCGPVRYEIQESRDTSLQKQVILRETSFSLPSDVVGPMEIQEIWNYLSKDKERLSLVAKNIKNILDSGGFPLILSERKEHLALISETIKELSLDSFAKEFVFVGELGKKARAKALEDINIALKEGLKPYILATGSLIGEGFDLPELDSLVLAFPISFKGRLLQYTGRIFRKYPNKTKATIYDYVDTSLGLAISMFKKRLASYRRMKFELNILGDGKLGKWVHPTSFFRT